MSKLEDVTNEIEVLMHRVRQDLARPTVKAAARRVRVDLGKIAKAAKLYRKLSLK